MGILILITYSRLCRKIMFYHLENLKVVKHTKLYAGINVDSKTVRHEKIFKYLDEKGLVNLYGPSSD